MISVNEELLAILLEACHGWNESPKAFLDFIFLYDCLAQVADTPLAKGPFIPSPGMDELAEIMIWVLSVNIYPYRNFEELKIIGASEQEMKIRLDAIVRKMKADDDFRETVLDSGVLPSRETMAGEIAGDLLSSAIIEQLRPYVRFK